jgi:hypothetical protein
MRALWDAANEGGSLDVELATQACAIAKDAAPYLHARLASIEQRIEAKVETVDHEALRMEAIEEMRKAFSVFSAEDARVLEEQIVKKAPEDPFRWKAIAEIEVAFAENGRPSSLVAAERQAAAPVIEHEPVTVEPEEAKPVVRDLCDGRPAGG